MPQSKGQNRNEFEQGRNRLMYLLEKVEDSAHVMDVPTRFLLHSGKLFQYRYGILLLKLFCSTVRKNCYSDREKFEAEGREFAKFLRSLEQFIQTVKGQNNFW